MIINSKTIQAIILALALSLLGAGPAHAQFSDCATGLQQMPMAEI